MHLTHQELDYNQTQTSLKAGVNIEIDTFFHEGVSQ